LDNALDALADEDMNGRYCVFASQIEICAVQCHLCRPPWRAQNSFSLPLLESLSLLDSTTIRCFHNEDYHLSKRFSLRNLGLIAIFVATILISTAPSTSAKPARVIEKQTKHFVAFKYKDTTTAAQKKALQDAFLGLTKKIAVIVSIEWGPNTSPENLNKGMNDAFLLTFKSAKDRDQYLVHPDHVAFKDMALPMVADAFIFDYVGWQTSAQ
jgi:hypothetical protein